MIRILIRRLDLLWMLLISVSIAIFILETNYINHYSLYFPDDEVDHHLGIGLPLHLYNDDDDNDQQNDTPKNDNYIVDTKDSVKEYPGERGVPSVVIAGTQKGVSVFLTILNYSIYYSTHDIISDLLRGQKLYSNTSNNILRWLNRIKKKHISLIIGCTSLKLTMYQKQS